MIDINQLLKQRSDYGLTLKDIDWIANNSYKNPNPVTFCNKLVTRIIKNNNLNKSIIRENKIDTLKKIAEYQKSHFHNQIDKTNLKNLLNLKDISFKKYAVHYRDLWRGYKDIDINIKSAELIAKKEDIENRINKLKQETENQLLKLSVASNPAKYNKLKINIDNIIQIEDEFKDHFSDITFLAELVLCYETNLRRYPYLFKLGKVFNLNDGADYFDYRLRNLDPMIELFPLRFMIHLPVSHYYDIYNDWLKHNHLGKNFDIDLKDSIVVEIIDNIISNHSGLIPKEFKNRNAAYEELKNCWIGQYYIAMTMLATTQTEGTIWDLAEYLNKRNIRIYKKEDHKYYPYIWTETDHKYERIANSNPRRRGFKYNRGIRITSARALLKNTRLRYFFPEAVYSYLVDEFSEDRNKLLHGNIENKNYRSEAIISILVLSSLSKDIKDVVNR